jgi:hypothetical protein
MFSVLCNQVGNLRAHFMAGKNSLQTADQCYNSQDLLLRVLLENYKFDRDPLL